MSKITLNNVASFQNDSTAVASYAANNATLTTAFDNTLSRDGTSPNTMGANLDMNSFRILNLPAPSVATDPVRLQDIGTFGGGNVTAPATNLDGTIVLWNGVNSKTIKDSGQTLAGIISSSILATNNTFTGTNTFNPVSSGDALTVNTTANSLAHGLIINQSGHGTWVGASNGASSFNKIVVSAEDTSWATGFPVAALEIDHTFGGTASQGARYTLLTRTIFTGTGAATDPDTDTVGAGFVVSSSAAQGTPARNLFAINPSVVLNTGATGYAAAVGAEVDMNVAVGASVAELIGWTIITSGPTAASTRSIAYVTGNATGASGWDFAFALSNRHGAFPMRSGGTIIGSVGAGTTTNGVDFTNVTFTGNAWKSTGAVIDGTGAFTFSTNTGGNVITSTLGTPLTIRGTGASSTFPTVDNATPGKSTTWAFADNGTVKWFVGKQTDNSFLVNDNSTGHTIISSASGSDIVQIAASGDTNSPFFNAQSSIVGASSTHYNIGGVSILSIVSTNYTQINDPAGIPRFFFGNTVDNTGYFRNASWRFQASAAGGQVFIENAGGTVQAHTFYTGGGYFVGATPSDPGTGNINAVGWVRTSNGGIGVASLPAAAAGNKGARAFVTDANASTFNTVAAAGGANNVPVFSDGTAWRIG